MLRIFNVSLNARLIILLRFIKIHINIHIRIMLNVNPFASFLSNISLHFQAEYFYDKKSYGIAYFAFHLLLHFTFKNSGGKGYAEWFV